MYIANCNRFRRNRQGAAVVEFAVCLPLIVMIVLGTLEASSLLFAKQAIVQSAYEAAIVASKHDGTPTKAIDAASRVALGRKINQVQVNFDPSNFAALPSGTILTVTVSAPAASNRLLNSNLIGATTVSATAVMVKE